MTTAKAINEAMKQFKRLEPYGAIRTIALMEGTGSFDTWTDIVIKIEFTLKPAIHYYDRYIKVTDNYGKITSEIAQY